MVRFVWLSFEVFCLTLMLKYSCGNVVKPHCKASEKSCTFNWEATHEWTMVYSKTLDPQRLIYDFSLLKLENGKFRKITNCPTPKNGSFLTPEGKFVFAKSTTSSDNGEKGGGLRKK